MTSIKLGSLWAVLSLAWLSVDEMESSSISKEVALQPGHLEIETPLPLVDPSIWTRLRYSMSPDRVLFYLWPRAEGVAFSFNVSARMTMTAKSAPSILYDYYNPEALSELPPVRWLTK